MLPLEPCLCAWNAGGDCKLRCSELVMDVSSSTACCSFSWSIVRLLALECLTASFSNWIRLLYCLYFLLPIIIFFNMPALLHINPGLMVHCAPGLLVHCALPALPLEPHLCTWNGGNDCELCCSELVIDIISSTACCSFSWSIVRLLALECLTASSNQI